MSENQLLINQLKDRITELEGENYALKYVLRRIVDIDPNEDSDEIDEWAEADCFHMAKKIAFDTITALDSAED